MHYFKYINNAIHNNFNWTVIEVEKIALKGEEKFGNKNLSFVSSFKEIEGKDILISSGAIQYIENFSLNSVNNKPKHILFSRLPIQDRYKTFVTLQNAKSSFNPQYIFNKKEFISSYENMGYTLVDEWVSLSDKAIIPFNREKSCGFYSGFYFKLKGGSLE